MRVGFFRLRQRPVQRPMSPVPLARQHGCWLTRFTSLCSSVFATIPRARSRPVRYLAPTWPFGGLSSIMCFVSKKRRNQMGATLATPWVARPIRRGVARGGAKSRFASVARVEHIIRNGHISRSYWGKRFYRHGRGFAQQTWDAGHFPPSYILRPRFADKAWCVYQKMRMLPPSATQSIESLQAYYWKMEFADEWSRRRAKTDRPHNLETEAFSRFDQFQRAKN
jgi:hypothetical protein